MSTSAVSRPLTGERLNRSVVRPASAKHPRWGLPGGCFARMLFPPLFRQARASEPRSRGMGEGAPVFIKRGSNDGRCLV